MISLYLAVLPSNTSNIIDSQSVNSASSSASTSSSLASSSPSSTPMATGLVLGLGFILFVTFLFIRKRTQSRRRVGLGEGENMEGNTEKNLPSTCPNTYTANVSSSMFFDTPSPSRIGSASFVIRKDLNENNWMNTTSATTSESPPSIDFSKAQVMTHYNNQSRGMQSANEKQMEPAMEENEFFEKHGLPLGRYPIQRLEIVGGKQPDNYSHVICHQEIEHRDGEVTKVSATHSLRPRTPNAARRVITVTPNDTNDLHVDTSLRAQGASREQSFQLFQHHDQQQQTVMSRPVSPSRSSRMEKSVFLQALPRITPSSRLSPTAAFFASEV